jgi:UDPglucose 6-dehydrogenase
MSEDKKLGVPQPDDDVVNREPRVLLIGYGWVGQYCGKYFTEADIYTSTGFQVKEHELYDLAIISVPTPMDAVTGQCNTDIVEAVVEQFKDVVEYFLIKSTVEIGTTDFLKNKYNVKIAMSPEYVGETLGHPLLEARRDAFQIIGGEEETASAIAGFWRKVLHANAPIQLVSARDAEIIKYCENYWITQRVDYWNDVFSICEALSGNFSRVREGLVLDPRFSRTHSNVYKDNRGWSGKCLPKDMNSLARTMRLAGHPLTTLEQQIEKNATEFRGAYQNKERLVPEQPVWKK